MNTDLQTKNGNILIIHTTIQIRSYIPMQDLIIIDTLLFRNVNKTPTPIESKFKWGITG